MAPFGKKFLKARLKNRSEGRDGEPGKEIQVWVRREEKTVCGLTKHTTCAEVVQALLEDRASRPPDAGGAAPAEYCLLERWKGFERALPPLTRILRLWTAWGDERPFVQFVLVSARDYGPRLAGSLPPPPPPLSPPGSKVGDQAPAQYVRSLPVDRQKRMVRKAFRKLGKMREQERATSPGDDGGIGGLVQLIISQDRALREQALRMRELDREIERAEWGLGAALETPPHLGSADSVARLAADDPGGADGLGRLDRQLERHRDLIQRLTRDIDAEMRGTCSAGAGEPAGGVGGLGPSPPPPPDDAAETERVRRDLEHSMYRGLALNAQLADLDRELELNQAVLAAKSRECETLAEQLSALRADDPARDSAHDPAHLTEEPGHAGAAHTELRKVLSHGDGTDTDSDTGISSTHSQDSLSPCGGVRPPLETQV
ncbi:ras association domain-containing protein 9-like [Anguilla anguilla]|uniref:ras association domain-containing protein 9-like n=1 Tax=Anguilla anguilla TaxID=7936 RepID=UPI0015ACC7E1|nr:ras association domain-containing protein 9-like [Anguilla anguilla]